MGRVGSTCAVLNTKHAFLSSSHLTHADPTVSPLVGYSFPHVPVSHRYIAVCPNNVVNTGTAETVFSNECKLYLIIGNICVCVGARARLLLCRIPNKVKI